MSRALEICVESVAGCRTATAGGAHRIELCANLAQGGTTPTLGTMRAARAATELPIVALIRPRAGDFVFDEDEREAMAVDIEAARSAGLDGLALGCLTAAGTIDRESTAALVQKARPLPVTFHRAFDLVGDRKAALLTLIDLGIERLLTSGGASTAPNGRIELDRLARQADGRIEIIAAGGVRAENAEPLLAGAQLSLHSSCSRPRTGAAVGELGPAGQAELGALATELEAVRALAALLASSELRK